MPCSAALNTLKSRISQKVLRPVKYSNSNEHQGTWKPFVFYFHECRPWQPDWTAPVLSVMRRPQLGTHAPVGRPSCITSTARRVCSWPVSNSRRRPTWNFRLSLIGFTELATITTDASSFCKSLQGRGSSLFSQHLLSNKVLVCEIISNTILPDSPFIHLTGWYFFNYVTNP